MTFLDFAVWLSKEITMFLLVNVTSSDGGRFIKRSAIIYVTKRRIDIDIPSGHLKFSMASFWCCFHINCIVFTF